MGKANFTVKFKDQQSYYLEDEIIPLVMELRIDKLLKEPCIKVTFQGSSSAFTKGVRTHFERIFLVERTLSINKFNKPELLRQTHEFEFTIQVPNGVVIPSSRPISGGDGGKIEYFVQVSLMSNGFFQKTPICVHILEIPLLGKVDIGEKELQKPREASIRWPKNEEIANTAVLSASIPRGACLRGKDIPVRIEFKLPGRYTPRKFVIVELIEQQLYAAKNDMLPDLTKQKDDRRIQKDKKEIMLAPELDGTGLLSSSQVIVFSTPSNATPTINKNGKAVRIDYKLRISVTIPEADSGKDKLLSVDLPIVIGTIGNTSTLYESGFNLTDGMSNGSIYVKDSDGSNNYSGGGYPPISPTNQSGFGSTGQYPGGFHMPNSNSNAPYPPLYPANRFVLNTQQLPFNSTPDLGEGSTKFESMPMPDFSGQNNTPPFSTYNNAAYDNGMRPLSPLYPPPSQNFATSPLESKFDEVYAALPIVPSQGDDSSIVTGSTLSPTPSTKSRKDTLSHMNHQGINKPNTPTPPQTPGFIHHQANSRQALKQSESSSSYYSSSLVMESNISGGVETEEAVSPTSNDKKSLPLRIDPLLPSI